MTLYALNGTEGALGDFRLRVDGCRLESGRIYSVVGPNGSG